MHELLATFAVYRRDRKHGPRPAVRFHELRDPLRALFGRDEIELVQYQPAWLGMQRLVIPTQLLHDGLRVGNGIGGGIERSNVDDVQQKTCALQMPKEL